MLDVNNPHPIDYSSRKFTFFPRFTRVLYFCVRELIFLCVLITGLIHNNRDMIDTVILYFSSTVYVLYAMDRACETHTTNLLKPQLDRSKHTYTYTQWFYFVLRLLSLNDLCGTTNIVARRSITDEQRDWYNQS